MTSRLNSVITLFLAVFSVSRSVVSALILWDILSDDQVDDSHLEIICCANMLFHKKM